MSSKRIDWIVSLRALAAMAVVLLHAITGWTDPIGGGLEYPNGIAADT